MEVHEAQFEQDVKSHATAIMLYGGPIALEHVIATQQDFEEAGQIINELKQRSKALEAMEKSATAGALKTVETIRSWFRPARQQAETNRRIWDDKIRAYLAAKAEEQVAIEKQLQAAVTTQDKPAIQANLAKLEVAPQAAGVGVRTVWAWREKNHEIVPTAFTATVPSLINIEMKKQLADGAQQPAISGIEFYQEQQIVASSRKK